MTWFRGAGLVDDGFVGFTPLRTLDAHEVPKVPGVYLLLRESEDAPVFLPTSPAGRYRDRNPSLPVGDLRRRWVFGAHVLYVGKAANNLRGRVRTLRRLGAGEPVDHWDGRLVWQLSDSADLVVAWKPTGPEEDPVAARTRLIGEFTAQYGRRPYANLPD